MEITLNSWFALYFGLLFLLVGGVMAFRVKSGDHPRPILLGCFAALVLASGVLCLLLSSGWTWFLQLSPAAKTPAYAVLGVAICFALLFSLIDVLNFACQCCCGASTGSGGGGGATLSDSSSLSSSSRPLLVSSEAQVYLVVGVSVVMGLVFGLLFGLLDVGEDARANAEGIGAKIALMREESLCFPIGALLGAIATIINSKLPAYSGLGTGGSAGGLGAGAGPQAYNPVLDRDIDEDDDHA